MATEIRYDDVVEACNLFPSHAFIQSNLASEVIGVLERRRKEHFSFFSRSAVQDRIMAMIQEMLAKKLLVVSPEKGKINGVQTPNNHARYRGLA
mgnify:CR=1 FL=1